MRLLSPHRHSYWRETVTRMVSVEMMSRPHVNAARAFPVHLLDDKVSMIRYWLKRLTLGGRSWPRVRGTNAQTMSFAHGPIILTNQIS